MNMRCHKMRCRIGRIVICASRVKQDVTAGDALADVPDI